MAGALGRTYLRILRVGAVLLALASLGAAAVVVLELSTGRGECPVVRIGEYPVGPIRWQPAIYSYDEAKSALASDVDAAGARVLKLRLDDATGNKYLGIGFTGPFHVPANAELVLDWERHGYAADLEFHVVDAEKNRPGEVFSTIIPLIGEGWTVSRIPLSAFTRNEFQDASRPKDGVLDPDGIQAVELGFPAGARMEVVIRRIAFVWGDTIGPSLFALLPLAAVGLLLSFRGFALEAPARRFAVARITDRYALVLVVGVLLLRLSASPRRVLDTLDLAYLGCLLTIVLLDEAWTHPLQASPVWTWRLMAPLALVILAGWAPAPLPYGLAAAAAVAPGLERASWRTAVALSFCVLALVVVMRPLAPLDARLLHLVSASVVVLLLLGSTFYLRGREQIQATARTLQLYNGIFHDSSDGIYTLDGEGRISSVNPGFERLLGLPAAELLGTRLEDHLVAEDCSRLAQAREPDDPSHGTNDLRFVDATGRMRYTLTRLQPVPGGEAGAAFQAISTDISERRLLEEELLKANRELQALSERDDLTALFNRRCFDRHLGQEFARARRAHTSLALVLCDIDYFKDYNDTVGHQGGDDVLRAVALLLGGFARRAGELAARYGGDEFALILPATDAEGLSYIGERIRAAVETAELPHPRSAVSPFLTLSIGAATTKPSGDCTPEDIIATADRALYQAKERGRNQVALLPELVRSGVHPRKV